MLERAFEAFNRGDLDAAVADIAPDCEYVATGAVPGATGTYRGPEGYRRFIEWLVDQFDDARVELTEALDAGDQVVVGVTNRGRGKRSGAEASWEIWQVWTVRDGRAVRGQGFTRREQALAAAGLEG